MRGLKRLPMCYTSRKQVAVGIPKQPDGVAIFTCRADGLYANEVGSKLKFALANISDELTAAREI
jgi:hypothetical protein